MALPVNLALATAQRATGLRRDPFAGYNFLFETAGMVVGGFTTISGLTSKVEVHTVREGGVNDREYKLTGPVTHGDLVFEAGLTAVDPMWLWFQATLDGKVQRRNASVYLLDARGVPVTWWNIQNAWPVEWQGPSFDASQTLFASQRFTLTHEGIARPPMALAVAAATLLP
ncbi:hypothetical protein ASE86_11245 [Sphingomonas sp. Leaf33]|uniref:phage tail protein n=1 Tax=Sphingomonas sp. Leaf33 TaxID=1736215 RepID=UPI0006FFF5F1|nr:phage tail protein [Sphingomonas sp. Leaf33]KQN26641.1 hypothetical protein ASE86_11245 [Sphingomonas sp. Leaf33]